MTKGKWFFKHQEEISQKIERRNYSRVGFCLWQTIYKGIYSEAWDLRHNETGEYIQVIAIAHKQTGFIQFYKSTDSI